MKNSKWKKICSCILAVCLIVSLLLSSNISGVFAEKDEEQIATQQETLEEGTTEITGESEETTESIGENDETETDMGEENSPSEDTEESSDKENVDSEQYTEKSGQSDEDMEEEEGTTEEDEQAESEEDTEEVLEKEDEISGEENDIAVQSGNDVTENPDWTVQEENGIVSVSGNGNKPLSISATTSTNRAKYTGDKSIIFGYQISSGNVVSGNVNITVTDCGIMSDDNSIEIWEVTEEGCNKVDSEISVSEGKVSFTANGLGEYLAVSNVETVDLAKGNVTVTEGGLQGTQQDGTEVAVSFSGREGKKYRVSQSNQDNQCDNKIAFSTSNDYTNERTMILDGINTSGDIEIPARRHTVMVKLLLRNQNQVHRVYYGTGDKMVSGANEKSKLTIDTYADSRENTGELYIPYKMNTMEEERNYVLTKATSGIGPNWSQAGIGGGRDQEDQCCTGLTIAGGKIRVLVQNQNGATAIGGGGNGDAQLSITGGDITAICSSTGSAIGGGIGWINRGGVADVSITGGKIYAENMDQYTRDGTSYGGVAIGSGSSMKQEGNEATIKISGGSVTAYARYGNGIGSGNSYKGTAAKATISISGNAKVTTNALGGGTSKENEGGDAEIAVADSAVVDCVKYSEISNKWDSNNENILGAFGIGGGNSAGSAKGGSAVVNVSGGELNCNGGNIGGGDTIGTGEGGDASICISDGKLDCASIGGGNSMSGIPGSVTSTSQTAGVVVQGGTLKTGTIGGGTNSNKEIGFATAEISGGNIQGQFILSNTDEKRNCFFHMTGGTIDNKDLDAGDTGKYRKAQSNGGAVYMTDKNGEVNISGGTIQNATAELGGAIYMTNGSFNLSGNATIQNCIANGNRDNNTLAQGGAVYLGNGTVTMNGGCILSSRAAQGGAVYLNDGTVTLANGTIGKENSANSAQDGAGVYVAGGKLIVNGGSIMYNTVSSNGAGAYLEKGSMEISSGQILHNTSSQDGAGAYLAGGTLNVSGGIITENTATQNGGGVFMNAGNMTLSGGRIYSNSAVNGAGAYLKSGNLTMSGGGDFDLNTASGDGAGAYLAGGALTVESGTFNSNTSSGNGGGAYLAGGTLTINGGSFNNNTALNGGGAYAADGKVRMFGGYITNNIAKQSGGGFYVSSDEQAADVVIRSGTISGNIAGNTGTASAQGNGGAIAVVSKSTTANEDHVVIGLRHQHPDLDVTTRKFTSFKYNDGIDSEDHTHDSCPMIKDNHASGNGGGIYMNSSASILDIYCLLEEENSAAADSTGASIMSEGGTVNIGDVGDDGKGNNTKDAVGNIFIKSMMLVKGGNVKIYGNTENPQFDDKILVNIQQNAGSFNDYRFTKIDGEVSYKIEYFENFQNSGIFTAMQYSATAEIRAMGNMYEHEGYKIIGWNTDPDGSGTMYTTGKLIGSAQDHSAWNEKSETEALTLYAIWKKISYTVEYNPNAASYSGEMTKQTFEYAEKQPLSKNAYKVTGKHFVEWNTKEDGNGISYPESYDESKMSNKDGTTIILYAQWTNCTHKGGVSPGTLSYTANPSAATITEICDCGGHTSSVKINGADAYYDTKVHKASLSYTGNLLAGQPEVTYTYNKDHNDDYETMPEDTTEPVEVGYYKASITIGDATVSVEYQIKSPADAATIDVTAKHGQYFEDFNGDSSCKVAQDDAFTVQYRVQQLNEGSNTISDKVYTTAPVLTLSNVLPEGTTIIMQTGNSYWYNNTPSGTEIDVTSFIKMGTTSEHFSYDTKNIQDSQQYRFVIDFSKVKKENYLNETRLDIGLKYAYANSNEGTQGTGADNDKEEKVSVTISSVADFQITTKGTGCSVQINNVSADVSDTRWERKNLIGKVTVVSKTGDNVKLPADAKLTVFTTVNNESRTATYSLNTKGEFIIPFSWTNSQDMTFILNSEQEAEIDRNYTLKGTIYTGSKIEGTDQPLATEGQEKGSANIPLNMPANTAPALKISGTDRVLTQSDKLGVNVQYQNIDMSKYTIRAIIQKKDGGEYKGNYYQESITTEGQHEFTLSSTDGAGSYRVWITVTNTNKQIVLEVPYYFIII